MLAFIGGSAGFMNSSKSTSPGCTGRILFLIIVVPIQ
jgi:hypothetical protein